MVRVDGKWAREYPEDLVKWLWEHDGQEAVVVDDANRVYYCSREEDEARYREAWAKERRPGDARRAGSFFELAVKLFTEGEGRC